MLKSIDDLKSSIKNHGGVVMQNRFNVIFNPPTQSLLNTNPRSLVNSFLAGGGLKSFINDPRDLSLLAISTSIPGRQIQTAEYQTFKETKKYVTNFIDEDVTMEFIITQDFYMKTVFDNWQKLVFDVDKYAVNFKKEFVADIMIQQVDKEKNLPLYGVKLINAFPTSISGLALSNESADTLQRLSVTFSYDKFEVQDALGSLGSAAKSVADRIINII
tara:strand:- start:7510 stop:8160 length:651 start_codon:yes stop_codon:yes gene_type:complete